MRKLLARKRRRIVSLVGRARCEARVLSRAFDLFLAVMDLSPYPVGADIAGTGGELQTGLPGSASYGPAFFPASVRGLV
jgi:hypothetical protein